MDSEKPEWSKLTTAQKQHELFRRQKELLDTFLQKNAISKEQHDRSLNCLREKMKFDDGVKEE